MRAAAGDIWWRLKKNLWTKKREEEEQAEREREINLFKWRKTFEDMRKASEHGRLVKHGLRCIRTPV